MTKKKAKITALNEKEGVPQPKSISEKVASTLKKRRKKVPSTNDLIQGVLIKDKTSLRKNCTENQFFTKIFFNEDKFVRGD